ncbi:EVE domain-containing protein [Simiduia sp. 21SJ11W-1]|uniref:EVE domain-containing protein n=1 Tax=Simiduia sp. 21SJ11W-1 TaxID=2909669 RepID=UPI00209D8C66|nr:EVE domain-containing protein [Simiduia sp. 21SJ11W-1]UTA47532.1 EVE domain-containing protein [Simiduia sp. 21SJ11W-1]
MAYWLFKTEPDDISLDDIKKAGRMRWDGIRNYQARNFLRDQCAQGDGVFIYHSQCKNVGVVGCARIVQAAYPDPAQFNPKSPYFDAKATDQAPRWFCVDIAYESQLPRCVSLAEIKAEAGLAEMVLVKQGRLSVQPVSSAEWRHIQAMAKKA